MEHVKIIKRAWRILWDYRALWVFGILLALTSASGGNGGSGGGGDAFNHNGNMPFNIPGEFGQALRELGNSMDRFFQPNMANQLIGVAIVLVCVAVLLGILATIVQYVSRAALIHMVDHYEATGEKLRWKAGWRLGWSRHAWRLFLVDLTIFLPVFVGVLVLFGCAAMPVLVSVIGGGEPTPLGIISTIGLVFLVVFVLVIVAAAMSLLMELVYRQVVLRNTGVFESIRLGWQTLRANFTNVFLMWLILIGIAIGFFIASLIVFFLLAMAALLFGGGIGAGLYFLVKAIGTVKAAIITGTAVGGLIALLVLAAPLTFLSGLYETFTSTVWTLTYRELQLPRMDQLAPPPTEPEPLVPAA